MISMYFLVARPAKLGAVSIADDIRNRKFLDYHLALLATKRQLNSIIKILKNLKPKHLGQFRN